MGTNVSRYRGGVTGGAEPGAGSPGPDGRGGLDGFYGGKHEDGRAGRAGRHGRVVHGGGKFDPNQIADSMDDATRGAAAAGKYVSSLSAGFGKARDSWKAGNHAAAFGQALMTPGAAGREFVAENPDLIVKYAAGETAYGEAMAVLGGGGDEHAFFGGAPGEPVADLASYEASRASRAKVAVVRRIARALKAAGVEVDPEGDVDAIVANLVKTLPNPRTNGRTFDADAAKQEKVCRTVARALNDVFTPGAKTAADKFVDDAAGASGVCHAIADWVESFNAGVNAEFLAVHASVRESLRGLALAAAAMERAYGEMRAPLAAAAEESGAPESRVRLTALDDIYTRARAEHRRQTALLEKALNVDLPAGEEILRAAMRDGSADAAAVKRMGLNVGTAEFGSALASAVSGLGTAATVAARVNKALTVVGLSAADYLNARSFREFSDRVDALAASAPPAKYAEFLKNARVLQTAFRARSDPDVRAALGGADDDDEEDPDGPPKSAIEKANKKRIVDTKIIVSDFVARLPRLSAAIFEAVERVASCVGDSIPTGEKVDALVETLVRLKRASASRKDLILLRATGAAGDRLQRDEYLRKVRQVGAVAAALAAGVSGAGQGALRALEEACRAFEEAADRSAAALAAAVGNTRVTISDVDIRKVMSQTSGGVNSLDRASKLIVHAARVGRMKNALASAAASIPEFAANYKAVLGEAAGYAASEVKKDPTGLIIDAAIESINSLVMNASGANGANLGDAAGTYYFFTTSGSAGTIHDNDFSTKKVVLSDSEKIEAKKCVHSAVKCIKGDFDANDAGGRGANTNKTISKDERERVVKLLKIAKTRNADEVQAKLGLLKAVQAVDLYLATFSAAVAASPDDVRDIKKMLDETAVVAQWFTGETAKSLAAAFEAMPQINKAGASAETIKITAANATPATPFTDHYYSALDNTSRFGNPTSEKSINAAETDPAVGNTVTSTRYGYETLTTHIDKALSTFHALKNLVNAFIRIGDRLGGGELRSTIFMSARQVFDALAKYLQVSALAVNFGVGVAPARKVWVSDTGMTEDKALTAFNATFRTVDTSATFESFDTLFTECIQAMAGKILVVVGLFSAMTVVEAGDALQDAQEATRVRATLGGAPEGDTPVVDGAAEMYFRIPRLVEFYRGFFLEKDLADISGTVKRIGLVPDFDSTFAKLIRIIFGSAEWGQGQYTMAQTRDIIVEINSIHAKFGDCAAAANALVAEVNRRFGLVKVSDYNNQFESLKGTIRPGLESTEVPKLGPGQFEILPDEGDSTAPVSAPGDTYAARFAAAGKSAEVKTKEYFGIKLDAARSTINKFRGVLDNKLKIADPKSCTKFINGVAAEMRHSPGARRYELAASLVAGSTIVGTANAAAAAFHETAVLGLNVLTAVTNVLDNFDGLVTWVDRCCNTDKFGQSIKMATDGDTNGALGHNAAVAGDVVGCYGSGDQAVDKAKKQELAATADPVSALVLIYTSVIDDNAAVTDFKPAEVAQYSGIPFRVLRGTDDTERACTAKPWVNARSVAEDIPNAPGQLTDRILVNTFQSLHNTLAGAVGAGGAIHDNVLVRQVLNHETDRGKMYHVLADYLVDRQVVFQRFVDALAALNGESSGLIEHRITKAGLQVGLGRLRETVTTLFAEVEGFLSTFEGVSEGMRKLVDTLRGPETGSAKGTLNWVRMHLIEEYFPEQVINDENSSKAQLPDRAKNAWNALIRRKPIVSGGTGGAGAEELRELIVKFCTSNGGGYAGADYNAVGTNTSIFNITTASGLVDVGGGIDLKVVAKYAKCYDAQSVSMSFGPAIAAMAHYDLNRGLETLNYAVDGLLPAFKSIMRWIAPNADAAGIEVKAIDLMGKFAPRDAVVGAGDTMATVTGLYKHDSITSARSILFVFNQVVAQYLATLIENGPVGRIYIGLVSSFANSPGVSPALNDPENYAWPDVAQATADATTDLRKDGNIMMSDPKSGVIITVTNAIVMARIMKEVTKQLTPTRLYTTLADVPSYMKEKYRAVLPRLIAMLDAIVAKCDYLRKLVANALNNVSRNPLAVVSTVYADAANYAGGAGKTYIQKAFNDPAQVAGDAANFDYMAMTGTVAGCGFGALEYAKSHGALNIPYAALEKVGRDIDNTTARAAFADFLTNVATSAAALSAGATSTLKELGDAPAYLSLSESFRETYKSQNGSDPLAYPSATLPLIAINDPPPNAPLAPAAGGVALPYPDPTLSAKQVAITRVPISWPMIKIDPTVQEIKYGYGTATIMTSVPVTPERISPAAAVVELYNTTAGTRGLETDAYLAFAARVVETVRELMFAGRVRAILAADQQSSLLTNPFEGLMAVGYTDATSVQSHMYSKNIDSIISSVEMSDRGDALKVLAGDPLTKATGNESVSDTRDDQRISSLLDLGIMPININALMRDIPLVNLYNYAYTFREFVKMMYAKRTNTEAAGGAPTAFKAWDGASEATTSDAFVTLMNSPYLPISHINVGDAYDESGRTLAPVARILRGDDALGMGRPKFLFDALYGAALLGDPYKLEMAERNEAGPLGAGRTIGASSAVALAKVVKAAITPLYPKGTINVDAANWRLANALLLDQGVGFDKHPFRNDADYSAFITNLRAIIGAAYAQLPNLEKFKELIKHSKLAGKGLDLYLADAKAVNDVASIAALSAADAKSVATLIAAIKTLHSRLDAFKVDSVTVANSAIDDVTCTHIKDIQGGVANDGRRNKVRHHIGAVYVVARQLAALKDTDATAADDDAALGKTPVDILTGFTKTIPYTGATKLHYYKRNEDYAVVDIAADATQHVSLDRFNTRLVRNLFFITNVQRVLRAKLSAELTQSRSVIARSHAAIAPALTEYGTYPFRPDQHEGSKDWQDRAAFYDAQEPTQ